MYTTYVGDDEFGSFSVVKDACLEKYGKLYTITTKEECVGHIQKRREWPTRIQMQDEVS